MIINNEILNSYAILGANQASQALATSFERLASGSSINRASDDPAGLVISEQMRALISGLEQEIENMELENSKLNVADSYMDTLSSRLIEMRDTALAAANEGVIDESQRAALQAEINDQVQSYNETIENAAMGRQALLDGSEGSAAEISKVAQMDLSSPKKAEEAVQKIDQAIREVNNARGEVGARQNAEIESGIDNLRSTVRNLEAAYSGITDTDYAEEYSNMLSQQILLQASVAMMSQGNIVSSSASSLVSRVPLLSNPY
jgi:flagellin